MTRPAGGVATGGVSTGRRDTGRGAASGVAAVRLPLDPGPTIDPFALAGATGILFHAEGRVLVGLGTALTIELPNGLDSDPDVSAAVEVLASVPCDDRFDSASSGRHRLRVHPLRTIGGGLPSSSPRSSTAWSRTDASGSPS